MSDAELKIDPVGKLAIVMRQLGHDARAAAVELARATTAQKNAALSAAAARIMDSRQTILDANRKDMAAARAKGLSAAMLDRLMLDEDRIAAMAQSIGDIEALPDPVGEIMEQWDRPNGLLIKRVRVPLGVIGIIYESRPNVTADASALCLKSGNAVILRGGSESFHSSTAIHACMIAGLESAGLPAAAVQIVPTTSRDAVGILLSDMSEFVDVIVPRGGKSLIARVQKDARVPVIGHLEGLCHVYVHQSADPEMARDIVLNAKMRRTGICGAAETLLIDRECLATHWAAIADALLKAGCELRGDADICRIDSRVNAAQASDWDTEYLSAVLSVKTVDNVDQAIEHISRHGSGHTES
ncbi:MAG: glutamate-5-semialdehyde dehydrogenase, partial [Gammaproteobacteria bacterium]|nr:glutamate-5-semialdehyde dehydrogenase [Gammaproteobacteria bacterium]